MDELTALGPDALDEDAGALRFLALLGAVALGGALAYFLVRARRQHLDPLHEADRLVTQAHQRVSELEEFIGDLRRATEALGA